MSLNRLTVPALALFLCAAGLGAPRAAAMPGGQDRDHDRGWDAPPREFNEIQRRGYKDGVYGAQKDVENHRRPDVNNRDEYRNPNLPRNVWEPYREGFRRGYQAAMGRLMAPPAEPPRAREPERGQWNQAPDAYGEYQRRGFQDGQVGAQRDFENHRRSDPNNRDEYRQPRVPPQFQDEYREGFRRGYELAVSNAMGEFRGDRNEAPARFKEIQRRGYQDGVYGAQKDIENHRRPDPNNRDEYRSPKVPFNLQDEYREGFRRGYEVTIHQLMSGGGYRR